jgi:hypothetical protein
MKKRVKINLYAGKMTIHANYINFRSPNEYYSNEDERIEHEKSSLIHSDEVFSICISYQVRAKVKSEIFLFILFFKRKTFFLLLILLEIY